MQKNHQQDDDFFSQYLGKSAFNFNASADLLKEMDQMHTSTGYVRGYFVYSSLFFFFLLFSSIILACYFTHLFPFSPFFLFFYVDLKTVLLRYELLFPTKRRNIIIL